MLKPRNTDVYSLSIDEAKSRHAEVVCALRAADLWCDEANLVPLRQTTKSQVFRLEGTSRRLIAKHHEAPANFKRELFAYKILSGSSHTPKLVAIDEPRHVLVLDCWPVLPNKVSEPEGLLSIASVLGRVHGYAANIGRHIDLARHPRLDLSSLSGEAWVADKSAWENYVQLERREVAVIADLVVIGDVDPGHVLQRGDTFLFCDLETFGFGSPSIFDVAMLSNICHEAALLSNHANSVSYRYLHARDEVQRRPPSDVESFADRLSLLSRAMGSAAF